MLRAPARHRMRLIASPAYRAFPELDSFSDGQCREFTVRARGSWRRRATFVTARAVAAIAAVPITVWIVAVTVGSAIGLRGASNSSVLALVLLAGLLAGGATWLLSGDLSLRLAIRRVMRIGGTCQGCGYVLVGLPVSASLDVTCPECGECTSLERDRAHCVPDATGQLRFLPSPDVQVMPVAYWTKRRARTLARRIAWAAAGVAGTVALLVGTHEVRIRWNESAARERLAAMPSAEAWMVRLAPPSADDPGPNALDLLLGFGAQVEALRDEPFAEFMTRLSSSAGNPGGEDSAAEWERCRRAVMIARSKGVLAFADALADCPRTDPRNGDGTPRGAGSGISTIAQWVVLGQPYPRALSALRQLSLARARTGAAIGDDAEVLRGAKGLITSVRLRHAVMPPFHWNQPAGVLGTSGDVIRAIRRSGGEAAAADLAAAVRGASWRPDAALVAECTVQAVQSEFCMLHVSADAMRWGPLTSDPRLSWYFRFSMQSSRIDGWLPPSFDSGLDAVATQFGPAMRASLAEPSEGRSAPAPTEPVSALMAFALCWSPSHWHEVLELRAFETMLAIERFRLARGRLPERLEELCPQFLEQLPKDPWSNGPLAYDRVDDGPDGAGYRLRSMFASGTEASSVPDAGWVVVPAPSCGAPPPASASSPSGEAAADAPGN
ncbi:MAG: hypothetical protein FGM39_11340 [Phycisphaerales bacterium]|nr:hypothetical protein [Phycisphaerales bacterium]